MVPVLEEAYLILNKGHVIKHTWRRYLTLQRQEILTVQKQVSNARLSHEPRFWFVSHEQIGVEV